jgi:hypothetical protein
MIKSVLIFLSSVNRPNPSSCGVAAESLRWADEEYLNTIASEFSHPGRAGSILKKQRYTGGRVWCNIDASVEARH